jgi:colanic acid biosynthesis glycosyl transferase WcaI
MRILLVTPYYMPDLGPSAPLLTMLSHDLVARGHTVTTLVAVPHFPSGHVASEHRVGLWRWSKENGVQICRVRIPSGDRANLGHRLWTFIVFQILTTLVGLRQSYDVALITNPALETWLPFFSLVGLRRKPAIWAVWDVYPDVGVRLGIFRQRAIIGLVKAMEDYCLRRARIVQVLAPEFTAALTPRGVPAERIVLIPPWLDTDFIRPLPRDNEFAQEYGLNGRCVVMYAGNLGYSQGLEHVLNAAQLLAADTRLHFVFVGDGANRATLQEQVAALGLINVSFIPFQPHERLPQVLASSDIALISLRRGIGQDSLPSKVYPVLASGRPIVAVVDKGCGLWKLVENVGAGLCVEPENPTRLARAIQTLQTSAELRAEMADRGREYAAQHHSRQAAAAEFERALLAAQTMTPRK